MNLSYHCFSLRCSWIDTLHAHNCSEGLICISFWKSEMAVLITASKGFAIYEQVFLKIVVHAVQFNAYIFRGRKLFLVMPRRFLRTSSGWRTSSALHRDLTFTAFEIQLNVSSIIFTDVTPYVRLFAHTPTKMCSFLVNKFLILFICFKLIDFSCNL